MSDNQHFLRSFGMRIRSLREEKKLSQERVAADLGVSRASLSFYEAGRRAADVEFLSRYCDYFEVSPDYVMGRSPSRASDKESSANNLHLTEEAVHELASNKDYGMILSPIITSEFYPLLHEAMKYYFCANCMTQPTGDVRSEFEYHCFQISRYWLDILLDIQNDVNQFYEEGAASFATEEVLCTIQLLSSKLWKLSSYAEAQSTGSYVDFATDLLNELSSFSLKMDEFIGKGGNLPEKLTINRRGKNK